MSGPLLLVLILAVVLGVVAFLVIRSMLRGRLRQVRSRSPQIGGLPPLPDIVGEPVIPATSGRYVGSALAPGRLDRIAAGDDGDEAVLTRYPEGIMVKRSGSRPIWIPDESITAIRAEAEMLVIRWRLPSGMQVATGFRGDDPRKYADWSGEAIG
ncbi:MAG TPA: transporter [Mycobacterium sp.]|nr:transporter [Mycobacterium sp.]